MKSTEQHLSLSVLSYIASLMECFSFLQIYTRLDKQTGRQTLHINTHITKQYARALTLAWGYTHTHTHTHERAHAHASTHARIRARTHTHTQARAHARARTHTHNPPPPTHPHTHTHLDAVPAQSDFLSSSDLPQSGVAPSAANVPTTPRQG